MRSILRVLAIPAVAAAVLTPLHAQNRPMSSHSFRRAAPAATTPPSNPAMWILRHCGQRGHSKTIARPGKRSSRSSSSARCRRPGCRGLRAETVAAVTPLAGGRVRAAGPRDPAGSRARQRPPAQSRRVQQHHPRSARRRHPSRRQFSGGHRRLRLRQHQRRAESLPGAAGEVCRRRGALGAHGLVRAGADEAGGDALPRPGPHQRYARHALRCPRTCSTTTRPG